MKKRLMDLVKGFVLGLDTTVPGFSIGTLAIILGIYERLIDDFSTALTHPWKIIKKDLFLGIGFFIGLIVDVIVISLLLENFPVQTVMTFVGLVFASIPSTLKKGVEDKKKRIPDKEKRKYTGEIITAILSLCVLIGVTLLNSGVIQEISLTPGFIIAMVLSGVIGAGFMIVPGVSGSLIIMALGYYDAIISILKNFGKSLATGNFDGFLTISINLLAFVVGSIIGIVSISKIIKKLLEKKASLVYFGIFGLLIGSPFAIIYLTIKEYTVKWDSPFVYGIGTLTMILGFVFGFYVNKIEEKNNKIKSENLFKKE